MFNRNKSYGIYNIEKESFQFQIRAQSPAEAMRELAKRIGKDAGKSKFIPKEIPPKYSNGDNTHMDGNESVKKIYKRIPDFSQKRYV